MPSIYFLPFQKSIEVESGHQLSKHPDKCQFPHGHSRKVEIELEADELDANDMVCDFKIVKETRGGALSPGGGGSKNSARTKPKEPATRFEGNDSVSVL